MTHGETKNHKGRFMGMRPSIEQVLYIDPQAAVPAGFCPVCGGELYAPGLVCLRCERDKP